MLGEKYKLPSLYIQAESSLQFLLPVHPRYSSLQPYSQATNAEQMSKECPTNLTNVQPVKFEDMSFNPPVTHEEILSVLLKCKTVGEQMETLASTLALSSEDIQNRMKFCKTMESIFKPFFNNFRIQMFGSTVNCFGFKGCDIDMTFETSTEQTQGASYLERPDIPLVSEVINGQVSSQEISQLPFKEQLLFMHTVLLEYYNESSEPTIFINAHVPLVRFYHDKYDLKCDLTFKNQVAYANTKLLYLFAKLDKRVIPLMMVVRYWAKHIELIGKGLMFNTYTITLLVIYFLQTRKPPILPSAEYILSLSNSFQIDDMNDKSFLKLAESIPPSNNTQSLGELLKEFFFFYIYFDFTRVICPLTATSVPREEFFSAEKNRRFRMNTICVQDPLDERHNVAELVDYKHCKKLYNELVVTCRMFQDKDVCRPSLDSWGLMTIFDKPNEYLRHFVSPKAVSFTLPLFPAVEKYETPLHERASFSANLLLKVLRHGLLFECSPMEVDKIQDLLKAQDVLAAERQKQYESLVSVNSQLIKYRKKKNSNEIEIELEPSEAMLDQFQKCNAENKLILSAMCKVSKNTWLGREFILLDDLTNSSNDFLDREHLISVQAAKQNEQNVTEKKIKYFMLLFECYISSNSPEPRVLVNFRPLQKMSLNPMLGIFLKDYITKIMSSLSKSA